MFWVWDELPEECGDPLGDLVADGSYLVDWLAGGIGEIPVQVALARVDRAGVAAAHGDDGVGLADRLVREWLGELLREIDPDVPLRRDDGGVDLVGWQARATLTNDPSRPYLSPWMAADLWTSLTSASTCSLSPGVTPW